MLDSFTQIQPQNIQDNVFKLIGDDWMLITAGNLQSYNTMTASWGFMGILWNKPIAVCFIRPQRFTLGFMERNPCYTLSFFPPQYRKALEFCGSKSGRDYNKAKETGLTPLQTNLENITFAQARLILECRKVYSGSIKEEDFLMRDLIPKNYPAKDFHRFYFGEVMNVYERK
jgi:flavin reductase (DIM6/NTAB) family NADH-FMN oxidoreductase RutF